MKVQHYTQVASSPVTMEGAVGCHIRCLVGQDDGAPNFTMRQFEIEPGGHTPKHTHPYEHEVFILEGSGVVINGAVEHQLRSGHIVYVRPGEVHQFRNTGTTPLKFLCLVPHPIKGTCSPIAAACCD
jgi:quercetin dioxygenase-like cupin family protein